MWPPFLFCFFFISFMKKMYDILSKSPVFLSIPPAEIEFLLKSVHHTLRKYKEGNMIAMAGDPCVSLLIVIAGSVKGEMIDFSGKVIKIEDIEAPRPLASAFLFGSKNTFPVNIVATCNTEILVIPKESFIKILQQNEQVLRNYLDAISSRTQFLSNKIRFLSFKTIKGKIAHYLLGLSGGRSSGVTLPAGQQELAEFFGVTRPSLARAMGEMVKEKIIELERREVKIIDREKLSEMMKE